MPTEQPAPAAEAQTPAQRAGWSKWVWPIVRIPLLVYLGLALVLFLGQGCLVYHPTKDWDATPRALGLPYEDLTLETSDGVQISAWYVPGRPDAKAPAQAAASRPDHAQDASTTSAPAATAVATGPAKPADHARRAVLFCHGNAGNISHRLDTLAMYHQFGLDVLIFDYRGYGKSRGRPGEAGTYRDADAAWAYLTEQRGIPADRIVVHGRSLGGAVAAYVARAHNPAGLVLESTFTSVPDIGSDLYPWLPVRWLARIRYDTRKRLADVHCPLLILHSPDDDIIPYKHGTRLFADAGEPKEFFQMHGDHNHGWANPGYSQALRAWYRRVLPVDKQ